MGHTRLDDTRFVACWSLGIPSRLSSQGRARWTIERRGTSSSCPAWRGCSAPSSTPPPPEKAQAPLGLTRRSSGPAKQRLSPHFSPLAPPLQLGGSWPGHQIMGKSEIESRFSHLESAFPIPTCHFSLSTRPSCRPRPCPWPSSPRSGSRRLPSPSCAAGPFACSFPRRAPP